MSSPANHSVAVWEYRDMADASQFEDDDLDPAQDLAQNHITEEEIEARIDAAVAYAQRNWELQAQQRERDREAKLASTLVAFAAERIAYFKRVEAEVVQLSLAIARKILEREAILDPTLLSGLVRIALDRLGAESPVCVRVAPSSVAAWQQSTASLAPADAYEVIADASLSTGECVVETSLGTADFGFESQLKEIESSVLDLLAKRPEPR